MSGWKVLGGLAIQGFIEFRLGAGGWNWFSHLHQKAMAMLMMQVVTSVVNVFVRLDGSLIMFNLCVLCALRGQES